MTTKIDAREIPAMTNADQNLGKNPKAKYLFHFLAAMRGFGERADTLKAIASEMYVDAPTQNNSLSLKPRRESDTRNKGDTRLAKLGRGTGSFKVVEAEALHAAFVNLMGTEWGELVSPEKLVLGDIRAVLREAIGKGLPWPEGLSVLSTLQLLALADEPSNPQLRLLPAGKFNIMSSLQQENSDLYPLAAPKMLSVGEKLYLQVTDIPDRYRAALVFIAAEVEHGSQLSNETFGMVTFGTRKGWSAGRCLLGPKTGAPFVVEAASGRYGIGVLAAETEDLLLSMLPADNGVGRLTLEECQSFLKRLRAARLDNSSDLSVSVLPYEVH